LWLLLRDGGKQRMRPAKQQWLVLNMHSAHGRAFTMWVPCGQWVPCGLAALLLSFDLWTLPGTPQLVRGGGVLQTV
jgi:hypothetical protein